MNFDLMFQYGKTYSALPLSFSETLTLPPVPAEWLIAELLFPAVANHWKPSSPGHTSWVPTILNCTQKHTVNYKVAAFMRSYFSDFPPQSALITDHAAALLHTPVRSREVGITHRRCGKRVAHCWHSSCSPWRMPPPLPLPSYSSLSISSNICCTCRDAALSNSWGTEKQQDTARSSIYSSVPSTLWLQSFILLKSKILHTQ